MFEQYPDVVTIEELQEMLGIGRGLAYDLVNSGKIKGVKVGRGWRISKEKISVFINGDFFADRLIMENKLPLML